MKLSEYQIEAIASDIEAAVRGLVEYARSVPAGS